MSDTKENILQTALRLFARDGYEAVSVRNIAEELGITKGALYRHYENKRAIFDSIVERMIELDAEQARKNEVPVEQYDATPVAYENTSMESIQAFTLEQFEFWTEDDFASNFRKMLTLEQYRSDEMAKLYSQCLVEGPVDYMEDLFRELTKKGMLKKENPKQLAVEYCAPLFLLINIYDKTGDKKALMKILRTHTEHFFEGYVENKEGNNE